MNEEKREHYSERLHRNFRDGDYLTIQEVRSVLAANRGQEISVDLTSNAMRQNNVRRMEVNKRVHLYLYDDLKNIVVKVGRGRAAAPSPTAGAERQRRFRERHRAAQAQDDKEKQPA